MSRVRYCHKAIKSRFLSDKIPFIYEVSFPPQVSYLKRIPLRNGFLNPWTVHTLVIPGQKQPAQNDIAENQFPSLFMKAGLFSFARQYMPHLHDSDSQADFQNWDRQYNCHGGIMGYIADPAIYFKALKDISDQLQIDIDYIVQNIAAKPDYKIGELVHIIRGRLGVHARPRVRKREEKGSDIVLEGLNVSLNNDSVVDIEYDGPYIRSGRREQTIYLREAFKI